MATTSAATNREQQRTILARPGKYLTFKLGEELYAVDILKVQEIIDAEVIRIPKTPQYVRGMINSETGSSPSSTCASSSTWSTKRTRDGPSSCPGECGYQAGDHRAVVDEVSEVIDLNQDEPSRHRPSARP